MGRTSIARKSESAILPTCLKTAKAATITAGSLVLMPFRSGTTLSWTVYLSRIALSGTFVPAKLLLGDPPHSTLKASSPRTLIARLLVLVNTAATIGKRSFFMVEKSKMARNVAMQERDLSTSE